MIFNVSDNSNWITYESNGSVASGSPAAYAFNKFSNFDLASAEDKSGIFYDGTATIDFFQEVSASTPQPSYRIFDGMVVEDTFHSVEMY